MIKEIKLTLTLLTLLIVSGCSGDQTEHALSNAIDNALVATSGNKPPQFFAFASPYRANGYVIQHKDYSFTMPLTKAEDWSSMGGWTGANIYGGVGISVHNPVAKTYGDVLGYGINSSSYTGKYGERQRAVENKDIAYIRSHIRIDKEDTLKIEYHGKENYPCEVMEYTKEDYKSNKFMGYRCYKFNPAHTQYKTVSISLIYTNSPHLPAKYKHLAKQYTYQDLQNRAKRTLDSLYIKDGW